MVCPTITRWVFHPGSGRWGHPVDKRLITIREAARLHSYSDNFRFVGTYIEQAGQIGNSVPPLLAAQIAGTFIATQKYSVVMP
jgi:DNA (cytosine-5)-methyltransferase 1